MKALIKNNLMFVISMSLLLIFLILGTFFDLEISQRVVDLNEGNYYTHNLFGIIFEIIGEMPIYLITAFALAIIFHNFKRRDKNLTNIIIQIVSVIISVGLLFYMNYKLFKYLSIHLDFADLLGGNWDKLAYLLLGAAMTFLLFYFTQRIPSAFLNKMFIWAFIVCLTAAFSQVVTHLLKSIAARPRFRAMFIMQEFDQYRKWFQFQWGIPEISEDLKVLYDAGSDWYKSFPSGHTSAGAMVITLTLIPSIFAKTNTLLNKIITYIAVIAYIIAVMFSRIIVGAHFLTDVTFGAMITLASFELAKFLTNKLIKKVNLSNLIERSKPCLIEESIN